MTVTDRCNHYLLNAFDVKVGAAISIFTHGAYNMTQECADSESCAADCCARLMGVPLFVLSCAQAPVSAVSIVAEGTLKGLANVLCLPLTESKHRWERCEVALYTLAWADLFVPMCCIYDSTIPLLSRSLAAVISMPCDPKETLPMLRPLTDSEEVIRNLMWKRGVITAPPTLLEHLNLHNIAQGFGGRQPIIAPPPPPARMNDPYNAML